jgi:hypothetical protein
MLKITYIVFTLTTLLPALPLEAGSAPICKPAPTPPLKQMVFQQGTTIIPFDPKSEGAIGAIEWGSDPRLSVSIHLVADHPDFMAYLGRNSSSGDDYFSLVEGDGEYPYIRLAVHNGKYTITRISDVPGNLQGGLQEFGRNADDVPAGTPGAVSITPITFLNDQHTEAILTCGSDSITVQRPPGFTPNPQKESLGPWNGDDGYRYTLVVNPKGEGYDVQSATSNQATHTPAGYKLAPPAVTATAAQVYANLPQALKSLGVSGEHFPPSPPLVVITPDQTITAGSFGPAKQFLFVSADAVSKGTDILTAALTYAIATQIMTAYPALLDQQSDAQSMDRIALALARNNSALLTSLLLARQKELTAAAPPVPPASANKPHPQDQYAGGRLMAKLPDPMDKMALAKALRVSMASGNTDAIEQFKKDHPAIANDPDLKTIEASIDPHGAAVPGMPTGNQNGQASPSQILGGQHIPTNAYPADFLSNASQRTQAMPRTRT